jgi:hypothetical protein
MLWPANSIWNKLFCGWQYHIFHNLIAFITTVYSSVYLSINCLFFIYFISPNKYINKCCIFICVRYVINSEERIALEIKRRIFKRWCVCVYIYIYITCDTVICANDFSALSRCENVYQHFWLGMRQHKHAYLLQYYTCWLLSWLFIFSSRPLCGCVCHFFVFTKLWNATISFVTCVCPSVSPSIRLSVPMEQLDLHWTDFHEIWYLGIFQKSLNEFH